MITNTSKFQKNSKKFWNIWGNETFYPLLYSVRDFRSFVASNLWGFVFMFRSGFWFSCFWDSKMFQSGFCDTIIKLTEFLSKSKVSIRVAVTFVTPELHGGSQFRVLKLFPICTNFIGYHSATECRSYDRPKIRQNPTLWTSAFGSRMVAKRFCADRE